MNNSDSTASTIPGPQDIESQFKTKLKKFCSFATRYGYDIEPDSHLTWPKFRTLPPLLQQDVYQQFCEYYNLCMTAAGSGIPFDDDRSLTWWALKQYGLTPTSEFFDKLTSDDCIEIYTIENRQIYRNWAFFELSSYAMGDLFIYQWHELYGRAEAVTKSIFEHASRVLKPTCRETYPCTVERHIMTEALSVKKNMCDVEFKYISPLFNHTNKPMAFIITARASKVGQSQVATAPKENGPPTLRLV